jgi:UDP-glucose 4-epimerase
MEDLCYQIVQGSMNKDSNGEIYNIGGQTLSLREAAEFVAKKFKTNVVAVEWPEKDFRIESNHTYFDDTKIRSLLCIGEYKQLQEFSKDL